MTNRFKPGDRVSVEARSLNSPLDCNWALRTFGVGSWRDARVTGTVTRCIPDGRLLVHLPGTNEDATDGNECAWFHYRDVKLVQAVDDVVHDDPLGAVGGGSEAMGLSPPDSSATPGAVETGPTVTQSLADTPVQPSEALPSETASHRPLPPSPIPHPPTVITSTPLSSPLTGRSGMDDPPNGMQLDLFDAEGVGSSDDDDPSPETASTAPVVPAAPAAMPAPQTTEGGQSNGPSQDGGAAPAGSRGRGRGRRGRPPGRGRTGRTARGRGRSAGTAATTGGTAAGLPAPGSQPATSKNPLPLFIVLHGRFLRNPIRFDDELTCRLMCRTDVSNGPAAGRAEDSAAGGDTTEADDDRSANPARGRGRGRPPSATGRSRGRGRGRGRGRATGTTATDTDLEEGLEIEPDEEEEDPEEAEGEVAPGQFQIGGVTWQLEQGRVFDPMDWNR